KFWIEQRNPTRKGKPVGILYKPTGLSSPGHLSHRWGYGVRGLVQRACPPPPRRVATFPAGVHRNLSHAQQITTTPRRRAIHVHFLPQLAKHVQDARLEIERRTQIN
ncbi:unnamed protein product, partial [Ectocarpus sp. 8 AP-2014]